MEVNNQLQALADLSSGHNPWYPLNRRLNWSRASIAILEQEKHFTPSRIKPQIIQPVVKSFGLVMCLH
jgi:hypothetical protein